MCALTNMAFRCPRTTLKHEKVDFARSVNTGMLNDEEDDLEDEE